MMRGGRRSSSVRSEFAQRRRSGCKKVVVEGLRIEDRWKEDRKMTAGVLTEPCAGLLDQVHRFRCRC